MMRKIIAFAFVLLAFPMALGEVDLQITSVTINNGLTHELSNDSNYFGSFGQNGTIDVSFGDLSSTNDVNATLGAWLTNATGSIFNTIIQNRTVLVPRSGTNSGTLVWVVNSTYALPTGRYDVTVFVEYPKNATSNKTVYDTSEYFNMVNLQFGTFYMKHGDKKFAPGDYIEFIHPVTNPGNISATPFDVISFWFDSEPDGDFDLLGKDSTGSAIPVSPDTTENRTYILNLSQSDYDSCAHSNASRWMVRSANGYGYNYVGQNSQYNFLYIYNLSSEYAKVNDNAMYYSELAPGDTAKALVDFENWGVSNITLHEGKGWLRYKDNETVIMDSVNSYTNVNYSGNSTACPSDISQIGSGGQLEFNFPNLTLSSAHDYEIVMAFDYGVPRSDYITVESSPYDGFNKMATTSFEFVEANLTNIYFLDEVAYSVDPDFKVEVENIGINSIDLSPKVYLEIYNSSLGYAWNQSSSMVLAAGTKSNKSFGWSPTPGASGTPLGSHTVKARYEFGLGGRTTKNSTIRVVSLGINNVTSPTVAPYESTNVSFNIGNLGPTNATVTSLVAGIGSTPAISLGSQNNTILTPYQNKSFTFSYYFDPPAGLTNGSYPINANLSYGGKTISDSRENITLLPVGIKSFSAPSQGNNETYFTPTVVLKNIAGSQVNVTLNLSSNLSGEINITNITLGASSTTTLNYNITLNQTGIHNLTITANYSGLSAPLTRSATTNISDQKADLAISQSDISFSPSSPTSGQNVTISATVRNTDLASASNFIVELKINGTSQENKTVSVSGNSSTVVQFYWTAVTGTHTVSVVLDPTNVVTGEVSETNNNATTSITVTSPVTVTATGTGGGRPILPTEPSYLRHDVELTGSGIADMIYKSGDALASTKYIIHSNYASLAGVYSSNKEVVFSTEISALLFESYKDSKSGNIIKKKPALLEAGVYELSADYVLKTGGSDTLVITRGDVEADSLAASTFTSLIDGKMLLVKPDDVPYQTLKVLEKFRPTKVYIIGGEEAISPEVENIIGKYAFSVERIGGKDRYETSLKLAKEVQGMSDPTIAVVTDGKKPVLYAATLAVKLNSPLVYVDESSPKENEELLKDFKVKAKLY
jgi:hypothetical protein